MSEINNIEALMKVLSGATQMTPLELNEIRLGGKKTLITPGRLKSAKKSS